MSHEIGSFFTLPNGIEWKPRVYAEICKMLINMGFIRIEDSVGITHHTVEWRLCIKGRPIRFKEKKKEV